MSTRDCECHEYLFIRPGLFNSPRRGCGLNVDVRRYTGEHCEFTARWNAGGRLKTIEAVACYHLPRDRGELVEGHDGGLAVELSGGQAAAPGLGTLLDRTRAAQKLEPENSQNDEGNAPDARERQRLSEKHDAKQGRSNGAYAGPYGVRRSDWKLSQ